MVPFRLRVFADGKEIVTEERESRDLPRATDWLLVKYGAVYTLFAQVVRVIHDCSLKGSEQWDLPVVDVYLAGKDAEEFLMFLRSAQAIREELRLRNIAHLKTVGTE